MMALHVLKVDPWELWVHINHFSPASVLADLTRQRSQNTEQKSRVRWAF